MSLRGRPAGRLLSCRGSPEPPFRVAAIGTTLVRHMASRYPSLMAVQVFGTQKSPDTRKALRFFSERGWEIHFVDLAERALSRGELRHFTERFGVEMLIDREAKRFKDLGLAAAPSGDERWIERLLAEPLLLRQPLVRAQNRFSIGLSEGEWKDWAGK